MRSEGEPRQLRAPALLLNKTRRGGRRYLAEARVPLQRDPYLQLSDTLERKGMENAWLRLTRLDRTYCDSVGFASLLSDSFFFAQETADDYEDAG